MQGIEGNHALTLDREPSVEQLRQRIAYCVGALEQFGEEFQELIYDLEPEPVDYYGDPESLDALGQKHVEEPSYVISSISEAPKSLEQYANCTGVVAVGRDKDTGRNISFLSHQNPDTTTGDHLEIFTVDFLGSLEELQERSESGSIDVAIFGGWTEGQNNQFDTDKQFEKSYRRAITVLGNIIQQTVSVDATVLLGPSVVWSADGGDNPGNHDVRVVFDTEKRRLYMIRPRQEQEIGGQGGAKKVSPGTALLSPYLKLMCFESRGKVVP